jgi:hypothetical protein
MSDGTPAVAGIPGPAPSGQPAADASREKESGRVAFDARGNAIWEWRTPEGEFRRDASTTLVRKLERPGLHIETTAIIRKHEGAPSGQIPASPGDVGSHRGFNPYESNAGSRGYRATASRPAAARPPVKSFARPAAEKSGILGRLRNWVDGKGSTRR